MLHAALRNGIAKKMPHRLPHAQTPLRLRGTARYFMQGSNTEKKRKKNKRERERERERERNNAGQTQEKTQKLCEIRALSSKRENNIGM